MDVRWRLGVLAVQLIVLTLGTKAVTGAFGADAPWFIAGLFAVVVNPQLIEHPFVRQIHVIANVILFSFLYWLGHNSKTQIGWNIAAAIFLAIAGLAVFGITVKNPNAKLVGMARAARQLAEWGAGDFVFSVVFLAMSRKLLIG